MPPHEAEDQGNAGQIIVSYSDIALTGAAAAVQLLPANPDRVTAVLGNAGAGAARIGDGTTAAAVGIPLAASATLNLDTTAAIYGFSTAGTTISVTEITRS